MHLTYLTLCISTLFFATFAQQQTISSSDFEVKCLRFPPVVAGNRTFTPAAITALAGQFANNTFEPPLPSEGIKLSPGSATRVGFSDNGGYQVCVQNHWFFRTQTISLEAISQGISLIESTCCDAEENEGNSIVPGTGGRKGLCQDAKVLVPAVSGDLVKVVGQDYGDVCCGLFSC